MRRQPPHRARKRETDPGWPRCLFVRFSSGSIRDEKALSREEREKERQREDSKPQVERKRRTSGGRKEASSKCFKLHRDSGSSWRKKKGNLHRRSFLVPFSSFYFALFFPFVPIADKIIDAVSYLASKTLAFLINRLTRKPAACPRLRFSGLSVPAYPFPPPSPSFPTVFHQCRPTCLRSWLVSKVFS